MARGKEARKKRSTRPTRQAQANQPDQAEPARTSSLEDRESIFRYWVNCRNVRATARHFSCSPTTIYRMRKLDRWDDRLPDIVDQVRGRSDKQAARQISKNVADAKKILQRIVKDLLASSKLESSVSDFVRLARYIDEHEGTAPTLVAQELLNDTVKNILEGSIDERHRIIGNCLAGIGITDRATVNRAAKVFLGGIHSQN